MEEAHYPQGLLITLHRLQSKIPTDFELFAHTNERAAAATHLGRLRENEVGIEDFHSKNENGVKQEIYAHFTHMTLVRQFTNRGEQHLNTDRNGRQMQASFQSCFLALQQHIEMLALKVSASLADKLTDILKTITMSHWRIRPFPSYPRKSHRPRSKWG